MGVEIPSRNPGSGGDRLCGCGQLLRFSFSHGRGSELTGSAWRSRPHRGWVPPAPTPTSRPRLSTVLRQTLMHTKEYTCFKRGTRKRTKLNPKAKGSLHFGGKSKSPPSDLLLPASWRPPAFLLRFRTETLQWLHVLRAKEVHVGTGGSLSSFWSPSFSSLEADSPHVRVRGALEGCPLSARGPSTPARGLWGV